MSKAIFHTHLNAQASKLTLGTNLQLAKCIRIEISGMRVQTSQHAADGFGDELLVFH